jgi:HAD superfamily hydrolase (TIGR01490 family)
MNSKLTIAAFDFDKTITTKDAFVPFLYCVFGAPRVWLAFLRLLVLGIRVVLKHASRDEYKARIIALLFTNENVLDVQAHVPQFAERVFEWVNPEARDRIRWHQTQGHTVVIVSASLDIYLKPLAQKLGINDLLATRLETDHHKYTGKLIGKNCRAAEKVERLKQQYGDLNDIELYAYGDSDGDKEMLAAAAHAFYRRME